MRQLVLAHATSPRAPSTVQLLLAQPPLSANHTDTFHSACTSLIGVVVGSAEYEPVVRIVANSLSQIANIMLLDVRVSYISYRYSVILTAPLVEAFNFYT